VRLIAPCDLVGKRWEGRQSPLRRGRVARFGRRLKKVGAAGTCPADVFHVCSFCTCNDKCKQVTQSVS
jgi:hypothetical protein